MYVILFSDITFYSIKKIIAIDDDGRGDIVYKNTRNKPSLFSMMP